MGGREEKNVFLEKTDDGGIMFSVSRMTGKGGMEEKVSRHGGGGNAQGGLSNLFGEHQVS